jgi:hypothetical protein
MGMARICTNKAWRIMEDGDRGTVGIGHGEYCKMKMVGISGIGH